MRLDFYHEQKTRKRETTLVRFFTGMFFYSLNFTGFSPQNAKCESKKEIFQLSLFPSSLQMTDFETSKRQAKHQLARQTL